MHKSDAIFVSKEPFAVKERSCLSGRSLGGYSNHNHRYQKNNHVKVNCMRDMSDHRNELGIYVEQKRKVMPINSLGFESELFRVIHNGSERQAGMRSHMRIANEPYKKQCSHPWKYSFKTTDYQTCTPSFRRVKSCNVDLSKY